MGALTFAALLVFTKLVPLSYAAEVPSKTSADEFRKHFEDHQRKIDRRVDVQPKAVSGISSGLIIVFGHALKPPYKIEFKEDRLIVNGIVVKPSPTQQREHEKSQRVLTADDTSAARDVTALMKWAEDTYRQKVGTISDENLEKQITNHLREQKIVRDVKWTTKTHLEVSVDSGQGPFNLGINLTRSAPIERSSEEIQARAKKAQAATVGALEGELKRGECVFFTTDGAETGCGVRRDDKKLRKMVSQIMDDTKLSRDEKTARLRELLGDDLDAALDVVANYRPEEWAVEIR